MSAATEASTTNVELDELTDNRSFWEKTKTLSKKNPLGAFGLIVVFVMVFMAVFADVITVHDPVDISFEYMLATPSMEFLLGTDQLGRDIFSRIVYGPGQRCWWASLRRSLVRLSASFSASRALISAVRSICYSSALWTFSWRSR